MNITIKGYQWLATCELQGSGHGKAPKIHIVLHTSLLFQPGGSTYNCCDE
jgi:hypothetical protein